MYHWISGWTWKKKNEFSLMGRPTDSVFDLFIKYFSFVSLSSFNQKGSRIFCHTKICNTSMTPTMKWNIKAAVTSCSKPWGQIWIMFIFNRCFICAIVKRSPLWRKCPTDWLTEVPLHYCSLKKAQNSAQNFTFLEWCRILNGYLHMLCAGLLADQHCALINN